MKSHLYPQNVIYMGDEQFNFIPMVYGSHQKWRTRQGMEFGQGVGNCLKIQDGTVRMCRTTIKWRLMPETVILSSGLCWSGKIGANVWEEVPRLSHYFVGTSVWRRGLSEFSHIWHINQNLWGDQVFSRFKMNPLRKILNFFWWLRSLLAYLRNWIAKW